MPVGQGSRGSPVRFSAGTVATKILGYFGATPVAHPLILLQGGFLGSEGSALTLALVNGSAAAAGTLGYIFIGGSTTPSVGFQFSQQAYQYDGLEVNQSDGLYAKTVVGGPGTVCGYIYYREVQPTG